MLCQLVAPLPAKTSFGMGWGTPPRVGVCHLRADDGSQKDRLRAPRYRWPSVFSDAPWRDDRTGFWGKLCSSFGQHRWEGQVPWLELGSAREAGLRRGASPGWVWKVGSRFSAAESSLAEIIHLVLLGISALFVSQDKRIILRVGDILLCKLVPLAQRRLGMHLFLGHLSSARGQDPRHVLLSHLRWR